MSVMHAHGIPVAAGQRALPSHKAAPVLAVFVLSVLVVIVAGGGAARFLIPALAAITAYVVYRRSPVAYVSFVWWLWFLSSFVRRIVDFRSGFAESNPIVAAPFLASLVCMPALFQQRRTWKLRSCFPFVLGFTGALYGLAVGLVCIPKKMLLMSALGWFAPLVFGFFVYAEFRSPASREALIRSLQHTFCWGAVLMGVYGVIQYVIAPGWDVLWMSEIKMGSIGSPEPFEIRVFSTMNGPGALAFTLVAALLLLIGQRGIAAVAAGVAGCATLLLSSVRSAWVAFVLALVLLVLRERKYLGRLTIVAVLIGLSIAGAMAVDPIRENLQNRFSSFTDMRDDTSYQDRQSGTQDMVAYALNEPLGAGLGVMDAMFEGKTSLGTRDSGFWEIMLSLGWVGGLVYLSALGLLAWNAWRGDVHRSMTEVLAGCIAIALLSQLFLGSVMLGVTGSTIWMFGALAMASKEDGHMVLAEGRNGS